MDWTDVMLYLVFPFFALVLTRLIYMKGYREGAKKGFDKGASDVLEQWKKTLDTEGDDI